MNKYTDKTRIYSGPNCLIYKATNSETNEIVGLKVVDVDLCMKPHSIRKEIKILKKLNHPNILPYIGSIKVHDDIILETPFYEFDLRALLKSHLKKSVKFNFEDPLNNKIVYKNQFPVERIKEILKGLASALSYLHNEQGIIHRDVKLANVFFRDENSEPVLGDFGIAYPTKEPPLDEPFDKKYLDISTGIYKAPEVCFGVTSYGYEIDIWSLGVILTILYSKDGSSFLEEDGNDLVLINLLFTNFGTPSLDENDSLYWPEMKNDKYHFKDFNFIKRPRKNTEELLPRCNDTCVTSLFDSMMVYERSKRITSNKLLENL